MKKKLDKVTRAMVKRAVLYLLDKYNIPYEVPVTAQNAVQVASQLYAEGILTAEMLVEINLSLDMLSELTMESTIDIEANLVLNTVPDATAAYSLRKVNANYTGPLIRVRRDAQEFDVGASNLELDTTYLQSLITQGENYLRYSENFSFWTVTGLTMTENQPFLNGINTARVFYPTATTGLHRIVSSNMAFSRASQYIPSAYIKSLGHRFIQIGLGTQQNIPDVSLRYLTVDCIERKIVTDSANFSGKVELLDDGWFRVWFTIPPAGTGPDYQNNYTISFFDSSFNASHTGDPANGIAVYGTQINTVEIQAYTPIVDTNTTTGTNIFVTTIYDQSGNNYNLAQTVAANQPQIVINGAIVRSNNKPAIWFDGVNDFFKRSFTIGSVLTRYFVGTHLGPTNNNTIMLDDAVTPDRAYLVMSGPTTLRLYAGSNFYYSGLTNNVQFATYNLFNATNSEAVLNNIPLATGTVSSSATTYNGVTIGTRGGNTPGYYANFYFQELVMYAGNQSATRGIVMNNINQYYQTYWDGSEQKLLDAYPNAAAAYSLRNLNSAYTGPLVRVRRASDNLELDIYGKYDGTLNTENLITFCSATNGFVTTWYDQSGLSRNAVQNSAAEQPTIRQTGVIVSNQFKPALFLDNSNDSLVINNSTNTLFSNNWWFSVYKFNPTISNDYSYLFSNGTSNAAIRQSLAVWQNSGENANKRYMFNGVTNTVVYDGQSNFSTELASIFYPTTSPYVSLFINSISQSITPIVTTPLSFNDQIIIGKNSNNMHYMNGFINEIILYNTDVNSSRIGIESNINSFYQIY